MANSLYYLLFKTAHTQRKKNIPFLKELNLAPGQPKVLRYLYEQKRECLQKDITKGCDIEPATVSIMLNKLESNGFIKRNYSEITFLKWQAYLDEREDITLRDFSKEERKQFINYLERLYDALLKEE